MQPAIADGQAVKIHFRLNLDDGTTVEDSFDGDPFAYVHGTGKLMAAVERSLIGKKAGEHCEVVVEPADAYGHFDPTAETTVPRAELSANLDIRAGMTFNAQGPNGVMQVWILHATDEEVVLSTNHPLAGQRLTFQIDVLEVREATADEVAPPDT